MLLMQANIGFRQLTKLLEMCFCLRSDAESSEILLKASYCTNIVCVITLFQD